MSILHQFVDLQHRSEMPSAPVLGEAGFVVPNMPPMTFPAEMSNCGQPANFCHSGSDEQTTSYTLPDGCIASVNHAHALAQNAGSEQVFRCLLKSAKKYLN